MPDLLVTRADLGGPRWVDIRIADGRVEAVGPGLKAGHDDQVLDAAGGGVVPGLHDHHVHLYSWAAARQSVQLDPASVADSDQLAAALRAADRALPDNAWLRGVGYHDRVAGPLDRHRLDELVPERPVRIQQGTGSQWILNTRALDSVTALVPGHPGIERDRSGSPTGRLHRMDRWVEQVAGRQPLPLEAVAERAARFGVTGFTDATPLEDPSQLDALAAAVADHRIRQRVMVMTGPGIRAGGQLHLGPVKLVLDDVGLPSFDDFGEVVRDAHASGRAVAIHCVTRVQLVLTLAVFDEVGAADGDRIEHGGVIPADLVPTIARLGLTVVTNPGFLFERGDHYLAEVEPGDQGDLYRCGSLLRAGIRVAFGTDAPFGPDDPWLVARAAVARCTRSGNRVAVDEHLDAASALSGFFGSAGTPGTARAITPGSLGDLCVLCTPLDEALRTLDAQNVVVTVIAGEIVADNR